MTRGPYRRAPRLHVKTAKHERGDVLLIGTVRWIIRTINGTNVTLEAANADPGITWHTTLSNLPAPTKETNP